MIPTGRESGEEGRADRGVEPAAIQQLVEIVSQLAAIAESEMTPSAKLELLRVQIGTAQFLAEQVNAADHPVLRGPHWPSVGEATHAAGDVAERDQS